MEFQWQLKRKNSSKAEVLDSFPLIFQVISLLKRGKNIKGKGHPLFFCYRVTEHEQAVIVQRA